MTAKKEQEYRVSQEVLSVQQVADELGVSDQAIRDWIAAGDIPAMKFGGRVGFRIERKDLERFKDARKAAQAVMSRKEGVAL